jgi:hypothetical protein
VSSSRTSRVIAEWKLCAVRVLLGAAPAAMTNRHSDEHANEQDERDLSEL